MKPKLLITDDDTEIATQMKWALGREYRVLLAANRTEAIDLFRSEQPGVVLLDLGLPPHPNSPDEGFAALAEMLSIDRFSKVIILSGQNEKENAMQAVGGGAYDFLCKPADADDLRLLLRRAFHVADLEREYHGMQERLEAGGFEGMLGTSPAMQEAFSSIRKVATSTAPALILGESGTGKEMVARAIHRQSRCKDGPFVAINCHAIPENLLESELFGHEKGAFTGAAAQRKGLVESAAGGTLFLDEIGDIPAPVQVKLLRFLQEKTFQRVGGRQELVSDARIVAATNADLKEAVANGTFREDLFFRVAVVTIVLPPLRDRGGDIHLVAREFLRRFSEQNRKPGLTFSPEAVRAMTAHHWPGNIRELQNRVQRAVIMADGKRIASGDLELAPAPGDVATRSLKSARDTVDRQMVTQALKRNRGRISSTAAELGISRPTLYEMMERLNIARD